MGILKLINETTIEQLSDLSEKRKARGLEYLQGPGNRRRGDRSVSGEGGRRSADNAPSGRRNSDIAVAGGRRSSNSTEARHSVSSSELNESTNKL